MDTPIPTPQKFFDFIRDMEAAASGVRQTLALYTGMDMCMAEGIQWLNANINNGTLGVETYRTNLDMDSSKFRATMNDLTKNVQRVAATTFPVKLDPQFFPHPRDNSADATLKAQAAENFTEKLVSESGYLNARRTANYCRSVAGQWGIGFDIEKLTGYIKAYDFDPVRLILDPRRASHRLHEHEYVIYKDVWDIARIKAIFGVDIPPERLDTVGSLTPIEQQMGNLSYNRLYQRYTSLSKMKGAVVYQAWIKGTDGHFSTYLYGVKIPDMGDQLFMPQQDGRNPFVGSRISRGLPVAMIRAHPRVGVPWGVSDVSMQRDSQVGANIFWSNVFRVMQKYAPVRYLVDTRSFGNMSQEDFVRQINNNVSGIVAYTSPSQDSPNFQPPTLQTQPPPDPALVQMAGIMSERMREQSHRSAMNFGATKSHVTEGQAMRALDEGDQVLNMRVTEDIDIDRTLMDCLSGTACRMLAEGNRAIGGCAVSAGLDDLEIGTLALVNPVEPGWEINVREGSVRHRSSRERKADLDAALMAQAIRPDQYARALARDLDMPLTDDDEYYNAQAQRAAKMILMGNEWVPVPLGMDVSGIYVSEFRRMLSTRECLSDPAAMQRMSQAIITQEMDALQGEMMKQQAMNPQPPAAQPTEQADISAEEQDEADAASLLAALGAK